MTAVSDRYRECFLYVDAADPAAVLTALAGRLDTVPDRRSLAVPGFELDVLGNDDTGAGDFVGWPTKIDVYASGAADAEIVTFVSGLMAYLRSLGHRVVAACDFEDELPQTDLD